MGRAHLPLIAGALALAACAGGGGDEAAPAPPPTTATTAPSTTTRPAPLPRATATTAAPTTTAPTTTAPTTTLAPEPVGDPAVDPCVLVRVAEVEAALGVAPVTAAPVDTGDRIQCAVVWGAGRAAAPQPDGPTLYVLLDAGPTAPAVLEQERRRGVEPVPELGPQAVWLPLARTVAVPTPRGVLVVNLAVAGDAVAGGDHRRAAVWLASRALGRI